MGYRPAKVCAQPSCPQLVADGSRCSEHRRNQDRQRDQVRGSRHQRGYTNEWSQLSRAILERDGHTCAYCGRTATTVDHVIPKARGGTDDESNLVAACVRCNSGKRDRGPIRATRFLL